MQIKIIKINSKNCTRNKYISYEADYLVTKTKIHVFLPREIKNIKEGDTLTLEIK